MWPLQLVIRQNRDASAFNRVSYVASHQCHVRTDAAEQIYEILNLAYL